MDGIHHAVSLELHPHAICASARESQIKLNLRRTIRKQGMRMRHIDQVVADRQHVTPRAEIFLNSLAGAERKAHLGVHSGNWLGRHCGNFYFQVFPILRRIVACQRYGGRRVSCDKNRLGYQLRTRSFGIEVSQDPIHAWLRKASLVLESIVRPERMIMDKELKILADNEGVKQFLVDDVEFLNRIVLPWIVDVEFEMNLFLRFRRSAE